MTSTHISLDLDKLRALPRNNDSKQAKVVWPECKTLSLQTFAQNAQHFVSTVHASRHGPEWTFVDEASVAFDWLGLVCRLRTNAAWSLRCIRAKTDVEREEQKEEVRVFLHDLTGIVRSLKQELCSELQRWKLPRTTNSEALVLCQAFVCFQLARLVLDKSLPYNTKRLFLDPLPTKLDARTLTTVCLLLQIADISFEVSRFQFARHTWILSMLRATRIWFRGQVMQALIHRSLLEQALVVGERLAHDWEHPLPFAIDFTMVPEDWNGKEFDAYDQMRTSVHATLATLRSLLFVSDKSEQDPLRTHYVFAATQKIKLKRSSVLSFEDEMFFLHDALGCSRFLQNVQACAKCKERVSNVCAHFLSM